MASFWSLELVLCAIAMVSMPMSSVVVAQATCCQGLLPPAPPEFLLQAPPKPPNLDLSDFDFGDCRAHDEVMGPSSTSEGKEPVSVGMIMGIVIGLLIVIIVILVAWFVARKKNLKYQIEPEKDQEKQGNFLYNYSIRGWLWRKTSDIKNKARSLSGSHSAGARGGARGGRKPPQQHNLDGVRHSHASLSSTSSESGYCEETLENAPDHQAPEPRARGGAAAAPRSRNRAPTARHTDDDIDADHEAEGMSGGGRSTTPDIIASAQTGDDAVTPTRWSLFGLLPSLKPVLASRGIGDASPLESPEPLESHHLAAATSEGSAAAGTSGGHFEVPGGKKSSNFSMKTLRDMAPSWLGHIKRTRRRATSADREHGTSDDNDEANELQATAHETGPATSDSHTNSIRQKKSRLRLKLNLRKETPEVNV